MDYKTLNRKAIGCMRTNTMIWTLIVVVIAAIIVHYGKIQNIKIKNGSVSRRFGLFKGEVCILSTIANRVHAIGYFPEKYFEKISEKIMEFDSFSYLLPCKGELQ